MYIIRCEIPDSGYFKEKRGDAEPTYPRFFELLYQLWFVHKTNDTCGAAHTLEPTQIGACSHISLKGQF